MASFTIDAILGRFDLQSESKIALEGKSPVEKDDEPAGKSPTQFNFSRSECH